MWQHADIAGLLDSEGRVAVISRNEAEAPIRTVLGVAFEDLVHEACRDECSAAFDHARDGGETLLTVRAVADDGHDVWGRIHMTPSPVAETPVLFHIRRLPRSWRLLSPREREAIDALRAAQMNPKKAARVLGISVNTLNAHRRSICQKCGLEGVGEFWVYVERCR
ncbi:MAG: hypothetical protein AAF961_12295 [Planctomycetota bacterium]